jgi:hypothetical protein
LNAKNTSQLAAISAIDIKDKLNQVRDSMLNK